MAFWVHTDVNVVLQTTVNVTVNVGRGTLEFLYEKGRIMDWLRILRAVLELVKSFMPLPDFTDEASVKEWMVRLAEPISVIIVLVISLFKLGRLAEAVKELSERIDTGVVAMHQTRP